MHIQGSNASLGKIGLEDARSHNFSKSAGLCVLPTVMFSLILGTSCPFFFVSRQVRIWELLHARNTELQCASEQSTQTVILDVGRTKVLIFVMYSVVAIKNQLKSCPESNNYIS